MFRSYLENNYFVYLLRSAYEDGFMTEPRKDGPAWGGPQFGRVSEICVPSKMPKVMYKQTLGLHQDEDDDNLDKSLREAAKKPIQLGSIIAQAWDAGQNDRYMKSRFVHGCSIEALKTFLQDGPDEKEVKKKAMRYATDLAVKFPTFLEGGDIETKWGLTAGGDNNCVIGWYCGDDLESGDYVEFAKNEIVSIGRIDKEARRAEALKLTSPSDTLTPVMGNSISEHYSWWEESVLKRGNGNKQPWVGMRNERQSSDFFDTLNDKIEKPKSVVSNHQEPEPVGGAGIEGAELKPVAFDPSLASELKDKLESELSLTRQMDNLDSMEEDGGVIMSSEPPTSAEIEAAKAAADKVSEPTLPPAPPPVPAPAPVAQTFTENTGQTITWTIENHPARTYTATKSFRPKAKKKKLKSQKKLARKKKK